MVDMKELTFGIAQIVPEKGLVQKLELATKEKRPLIVKLGMDPTAPDLHLGHAVVLKKIRQFQELGHDVVLLIGDFTARIGDPSGRNVTRPPLTEEQIQINAKTYVDQLNKIIDVSKVRIAYNSSWLSKQSFADVLKLLSTHTLAQMLQRDEFNNRFTNNLPISLHELVYPLMQGYDSVALKADIEFGGTDQLFNCVTGKDVQAAYGMTDTQTVIAMPLLRGMDGIIKMSKSKGNYIGLTEDPNTMYGKAMSIPDDLIEEWLDLATDFSLEEKSRLRKEAQKDPMKIKKMIAFNIVQQYHSEQDANAAELFFYQNVQSRDLNDKAYQLVSFSSLGLTEDAPLLDLCHALLPEQSKGAIRKIFEGGGIAVNGDKESDPKVSFTLPVKLKIGKRNFFEVA